MDKFSFQPQLFTEGALVLTDASDTEADSDIFEELVKSGVQAFKVGYRKQATTGKTDVKIWCTYFSDTENLNLVRFNISDHIIF